MLSFTLFFYFLSAGDVWFSLRSTRYQNNSLVSLTDIGDGNDALHCKTNLTGVNGSIRGDWYFPNGTRVLSTNGNSEIHRTRDQMVVRMNRRGGGKEGIYHCEIPDAMEVNQTIYIGVYNTNSGE